METCQKDQRLCGHPETLLKTERATTASFMEPPTSLLFQFFAPSPFKLISFTRPASLAKSSKRRQTCEQCCVSQGAGLPWSSLRARTQLMLRAPVHAPVVARRTRVRQPRARRHQPQPPGMLLGVRTSTANRAAAPPAASQSGLLVSYIFFSLTFL